MRLTVVCLAALALLAACEPLSDKEAENLRFIRDLTPRDGLIPVQDHNFAKLVLAKYRPYHTLVLFTSANMRGECSACEGFASELSVLAASYELHVKDHPDTPPVFFLKATYHENQQTFQAFNIRGVPMLAYFGPTAGNVNSKSALPPMFMEEVHEAEKMNGFMRGYTGVSVEIYRSPIPALFRLASLIAFVALIVKFASDQVWAVTQYVLNNKTIWMFISLSIYFISVSGVLYDIIRGVPFVGGDAQGNPVFVSGSGSQFVLEGLFIGGLNIGCAAFALLMKRKMAESGGKTTDAAGRCLMYGAGFAIFYRLILTMYRSKNRWY